MVVECSNVHPFPEIPRVESEAEQVMNEHVTAEALVKEDGRGDSGSGLSSGVISPILHVR